MEISRMQQAMLQHMPGSSGKRVTKEKLYLNGSISKIKYYNLYIWYNIPEGKFQMGKTNIIQLYPSDSVRHEQRMPVNKEISSVNSESLNISNLRLLSINKASKVLGIRYETVVKLVKTGRIKSVMTVNNKYKIPYISLVEFVNGSKEVEKVTNQIIPLEVTQNRIDILLKEYAG